MQIGDVYAVTAIVSLLQILLVYSRVRFSPNKNTIEISFLWMLRFFIAFCLVDCLWGLCYAGTITSHNGFIVISYFYHLMSSLSAFVWMSYIIQFTRLGKKATFILSAIAIMLVLAQIVIIAVNVFSRMVFYVDADGGYHINTHRYVLYFIQYTYYLVIIVSSAILYYLDNPAEKSKHRAALLFSVPPLAFGIGQYFFFDIGMYSLGFAYTAALLFLYRQSLRDEQFLEQQFTSVSHEQLAIIRGLAGNFSAIYYVDIETGAYDKYVKDTSETGLVRMENSNKDWFKESVYYGKAVMSGEDIDRFLLEIDKKTLLANLEEKDILTYVFKIKDQGTLKYFEYRLAKSHSKTGDRIILGMFDIDKEYREKLKQQEEIAATMEEKTALEKEASFLDMAAHRDIMTGLFNRRAYEDHMVEYGGKPDAPDFVYISFDVNGLKAANDDLGHDAGDELIKGAAFCMKKVFGVYGRVYRHGGDEFSAMIHAGADVLKDAIDQFELTVAEWHGELVKNLTVSYGCAVAGDCPNATTIEDLEKIADARMYEYKARYYARKGIDRRGQQEAYDALRESYIKVLKVDLINDTFGIIKADMNEIDESQGYNEKFSEWIVSFAKAGNVHESDRAEYIKRTSREYLQHFFKKENHNFALRYKRRAEHGYKESLMEIIPAKDFSEESQIVFLYVKSIDNEGLYLKLQELKSSSDLTVQILWEHSQIEFRSKLVKTGTRGIYITPYLRDGKPLNFDIAITDNVQCNLYAVDTNASSGRIVWNDVELQAVEEPEGLLYHITTRQFNQYSRPGERRIHERTSSDVVATISDMSFHSTEVILHDISDNGISFYATEPLSSLSDTLNIKFNDTINGEQFIINTTIKIVRNYEKQGKMYYGCRVMEPTSDYQLYVFLHRLHMK